MVYLYHFVSKINCTPPNHDIMTSSVLAEYYTAIHVQYQRVLNFAVALTNIHYLKFINLFKCFQTYIFKTLKSVKTKQTPVAKHLYCPAA